MEAHPRDEGRVDREPAAHRGPRGAQASRNEPGSLQRRPPHRAATYGGREREPQADDRRGFTWGSLSGAPGEDRGRGPKALSLWGPPMKIVQKRETPCFSGRLEITHCRGRVPRGRARPCEHISGASKPHPLPPPPCPPGCPFRYTRDDRRRPRRARVAPTLPATHNVPRARLDAMVIGSSLTSNWREEYGPTRGCVLTFLNLP